MQIQSSVKKFDYRSLSLSVYGGAHDAIIGEWIKWWISDTKRTSIKRAVINPAMQACFRGKQYYADLLLAEHSHRLDSGEDQDDEEERNFFRLVGVAEIENDNSLEKLEHRVNSLEAYEKGRDKHRRLKFGDLEFALLCTFYQKKDFNKKEDEIEKIKDLMRHKSINSSMKWILYILKKDEISERKEFFFKVKGYADDSYRTSFYYPNRFIGKPIWHIYHKGKKMRV